MPPDPIGIVVLVSGSCGVAQAPRETELVKQLIENSVATFAVDLLTPTEASDRGNQRNLDLLSERVAIVTDWISERDGVESLDVGYYGTGTGGSAVLQFVKYGSVPVRAVALYNGRPDLSTTVPSVPVFCAVDEGNEHLLETNEQFYERVKQSKARSEFLRAEEGTQVIPQMAHWFGASFRRAGSSPYRT
jgi:dienelactone hydrolase